MQEEDLKDDKIIAKSLFTEWLEKLQQESWQLELLISGFAIFGIYSARPFINELDITQSLYFIDFLGLAMNLGVSILENGWFIFFINLLIHVIFRGLWIGAIGLRYVSNEIEYDKLRYSDKFTNFLKEKVGTYDDYIERLEKLCSVIFAYTFLLFLLFCSFTLFFGEFILLRYFAVEIFGEQSFIASTSILVFLGLGILVFIDFITLGSFKKIKEKSISIPYFWMYRFFSFITLSFLYRPLLYNFIDNSYTKKLFYLSIPYIFLILFSDNIFYNNAYPYVPSDIALQKFGLVIDDNNYDDRRTVMLNEFPNEDRKIHRKIIPDISLESFEVEKNISSFFILLDKKYERFIKKNSTLIAYYKDGVSIKLFDLNEAVDSNMNALRDKKTSLIRALYASSREKKRMIRKGEKSPLLTKEIEQNSFMIDSISKVYDKKIEDYSKQKAALTLESYLKAFEVSINEVPVDLNQCFYHYHPNFGELGIKCFFGVDSLKAGIQEFKLKTKFIKSNEELDSTEYKIPIIKIN